MKTIYKFGYKINNRSENWIRVFREIFNIDFQEIRINSEYENTEKNWYETFYKSQKLKEERYFLGHKLSLMHLGFNRYQEYVYITLVFDEQIDDIKLIRDFLIKHLQNCNFVDNFEIPFKEPDLYKEYEDEYKYREIIILQNPIYIFKVESLDSDSLEVEMELNKHSNRIGEFKNHNLKDFKIFHRTSYINKQKDAFYRKFEQLFFIKNYEDLELVIDHFHSIFVLFHRAESHYKSLRVIDMPSKALFAISNKLNDEWPKGRMSLFLLNRFTNASLYNMTFFNILELNAQMNSIFCHINIKYKKIEDQFNKQYERVLYNFEKSSENLTSDYYKEIFKYIKAPSIHRENVLIRIREFFEPTDRQIEKLRNDNDSKVNLGVQWIMSILSAIIFFWGITTFWYQGTILVEKKIVDTFNSPIGFIPSYMTTIIFVTITIMMGIVIYFLIINSSITSKESRDLIKTRNINISSFVKKADVIIAGRDKVQKKRLLKLTDLLKLVTSYIILNLESILCDSNGDDDCRSQMETLLNYIERF
jgi:hypothetical protein